MTFTLHITPPDAETVGFVGNRYCWSTALSGYCGVIEFSTSEGIQLCKEFMKDTEGNHQLFPMLDVASSLYRKLQSFMAEVDSFLYEDKGFSFGNKYTVNYSALVSQSSDDRSRMWLVEHHEHPLPSLYVTPVTLEHILSDDDLVVHTQEKWGDEDEIYLWEGVE